MQSSHLTSLFTQSSHLTYLFTQSSHLTSFYTILPFYIPLYVFLPSYILFYTVLPSYIPLHSPPILYPSLHSPPLSMICVYTHYYASFSRYVQLPIKYFHLSSQNIYSHCSYLQLLFSSSGQPFVLKVKTNVGT